MCLLYSKCFKIFLQTFINHTASANAKVWYMFKVLIKKRHTIMTETKGELMQIVESGDKYFFLFFPFEYEDWEEP